jgi:phosphotriesterase-related protein
MIGRIKTIKSLIDAGYTKRLLLSHDAVLVSTFFDTLSYADKEKIAKDNPYGFLYINKVVMPGLRELGVSDEILKSLLTDNPRRFFEGNED